MQVISLDVIKVEGQANKARAIKESVERINRNLKVVEGLIGGCWKGAAAEAYFSQLNNWYNETTRLTSEMDEISNSLNRIAKEFKEADNKVSNQILTFI